MGITTNEENEKRIQMNIQKKIRNTLNFPVPLPEIAVVTTLVHNLPEFPCTYLVYMNSHCNIIFITSPFFS